MDLSKNATKLYSYLKQNHWDGTVLKGPDSGIRLNLRFGRFIKSYFDFVIWQDNKIYIQAQCYWILDNWLMYDLKFSDPKLCKEIALLCSEYLVNKQSQSGYWDYPEKGWVEEYQLAKETMEQ